MEFIIKPFRVIFRLFLFSIYITIHIVRGFKIKTFEKDPLERKRQFSRSINRITALCCRTFAVRVAVINPPPQNARGLIVGNHLGFIDIIASGSIRPMLYVTSLEMRQTPVLGLLTEMAGCIYVERRSRMGIQQELKQIINSLEQGFNVCLYPEATSHNGEHVLPFKRTLITAAAYAGVPILPYVFNFKSIQGEDFTLKNRDHVCWYGDIPFLVAMVKALSLKYVDVEIKFLAPFHPTPEMERAEVANKLHQMISNEFAPVKLTHETILQAQQEGI